MRWIAHSPSDLPAIAQAIIEQLGTRRKIALLGDMGAGKTTFVRAFCAVLGVDETATSSPTFSLINEYSYSDTGEKAKTSVDIKTMHHLDLYRLKTLEEAIDIGIEEVLDDPWYCLIEWPQVIGPILPEDTAVLRIELNPDLTRTFVLDEVV
jgi:tRNA threonylcarbamoyladenosine biosynthesis protein TsaE